MAKKLTPKELEEEIYSDRTTVSIRIDAVLHSKLSDVCYGYRQKKSEVFNALVADFLTKAEKDPQVALLDLHESYQTLDERIEAWGGANG